MTGAQLTTKYAARDPRIVGSSDDDDASIAAFVSNLGVKPLVRDESGTMIAPNGRAVVEREIKGLR
jgi:hypothetical protein